MTALDSLERNMPGYLARASVHEIVTVLMLVRVELQSRLLPGVNHLHEAAHGITEYVSALERARPAPPIHSDDCTPTVK